MLCRVNPSPPPEWAWLASVLHKSAGCCLLRWFGGCGFARLVFVLSFVEYVRPGLECISSGPSRREDFVPPVNVRNRD